MDIDLAVKAARKAMADDAPWRKMTAHDRSRIMHTFADLVEKNGETLAQLESLDNGKPIAHARGADVSLSVSKLRYWAGIPEHIIGDVMPSNGPWTA